MNKLILCLVPIMVILQISCQKTATEKNPIVETKFLLGAPLSIQLFNEGSKALLNDIYQKIEQIEITMSTSVKDYSRSEIIDINNKSKTLTSEEHGNYTISKDTAIVLEKSLYIAKVTEGAFDPTIAPLVALWGWSSGAYHVPSNEEIAVLLPLIDWTTMAIKSRSDNEGVYELRLRGQQNIDVGGIAKGYAADVARTMLLAEGVRSAIIDFGGNIITIGAKSDKSLWKIGIQEPFAELGKIVAILEIEEAAVVTSGIYERYFEEQDKQYSHIINPKDGYAIDNGLVSVTIVSKESIIADGFSTGIFVLGLEEGMKLVELTTGIEAIFITDNNLVHVSSGLQGKKSFNASVSIISEEYRIK